MSGSYQLKSLTDKPTDGLFEGKLVVDKTYGYAVHGCASCCPEYDPYILANPLNLTVGGSSYQAAWSYDNCSGNTVQLSASNWGTGNAQVATANITSGLVSAVGVGSTTNFASVRTFYPNSRGYCTWSTVQRSSTVNVAPTISGGNTVWWFNGQNPNQSSSPVSVTLTSSGGSSTTWSVTQADAKVNLSTTTGAQTTVTTTGSHFSGSVGDISITATANSVTSAPFTMTARTPWKLVLRSRNTTCYSSPQTYSTTISYDVHDNLDQVISADIYWNEPLGSAQCQNGSNWCNYQIISGGADSDPLQDMLEPPDLNVSPPPSPKPTCSGQGSGTTRYRSIAQTIRVGTNTTGGGVTVQSDTLGYYIDHGQHDGIQTPTPPPQ